MDVTLTSLSVGPASGTPTRGPGAGPFLEKYANNFARPGKQPDSASVARVARWHARGVLWDWSSLERVRKCGRVAVDTQGVGVRANGVAVGYSGLATCGSVWACPVCNSKVQAYRRLEVGVALETALATGGAAFGAYTVRHTATADLDATWRALSRLWTAVGQDKGVRQLRRALGWIGYIRAAEVTYGRHGWHPHLHPLHLFDRPVSDADVAALFATEYGAWSRAADRYGYAAPQVQAQDLHRVTRENAARDLADYFAKVTWEMTSTQTKSAWRGVGSRTPWELLATFYTSGDLDDLDIWHAWEKGSKGKRALTWSRGLRERLGLLAESKDEDIAASVVGGREDEGFIIADWAPIRDNPQLGALLLNVIGPAGDWAAGRALCETYGISLRG